MGLTYVVFDRSRQEGLASGRVRLARVSMSGLPELLPPFELEDYIARRNFRAASAAEADAVRAKYRELLQFHEDLDIACRTVERLHSVAYGEIRPLLYEHAREAGMTPRRLLNHLDPYWPFLVGPGLQARYQCVKKATACS